MVNWHSFIGLHPGYLAYFSLGKTMLAAALTYVQSYFRHSHLLLSGKASQICKVDIVVMALTKDILISLPKKVSESFLFFFGLGFFVFSMRKMSRVFDRRFKGWNATIGCTCQWLEECCSQQMNTDRVYLLCVASFFSCVLLIDTPQGGGSSDSDTKQVPKENTSFKRE